MHRLSALAALMVLPMGATAGEPAPNINETINRGLTLLAKDSLTWEETEEMHRVPPRAVHRLGPERGKTAWQSVATSLSSNA